MAYKLTRFYNHTAAPAVERYLRRWNFSRYSFNNSTQLWIHGAPLSFHCHLDPYIWLCETNYIGSIGRASDIWEVGIATNILQCHHGHRFLFKRIWQFQRPLLAWIVALIKWSQNQILFNSSFWGCMSCSIISWWSIVFFSVLKYVRYQTEET